MKDQPEAYEGNIAIDIRKVVNGFIVEVLDYPGDGKRIASRKRVFVASDAAGACEILSQIARSLEVLD